jgi:Holliday junction resolvasome RuvABC endonuclease subunit
MTKDFLGIDPGLSGGFAVVSGDRIRCKMVMPTLSFTREDDTTKTVIDREGVLSFLKKLPPHMHVVIEEQEAFRSQNITSTCTLCKNYGMLLMALTVAQCYVTEVPASVWQEHYGIVSVKKSGGASTKAQAFAIVQTIYPREDFRKSDRSRKFHDGIVDATLIARYCQSLFAPLQGAVTRVQCISSRDETPVELKGRRK